MVANQESINHCDSPSGQVTQPAFAGFDVPVKTPKPRRQPRQSTTTTLAPYQLRAQAIRKVEATFTGYVTASTILMRCWEGENADVAEAAALRQYDQSAKALRSFVESALALGVPAVDLMMAIADSLAEGKGE